MILPFTVFPEELSFFLEERGIAASVKALFLIVLKSLCIAQEPELLQAILGIVSEDTIQVDYITQ